MPLQILHLGQKNGRLFQRAVSPAVANEIVTLMWLCWKPTYSHTTPKEQWNTIIICSHLQYVSFVTLIIIRLSFSHVDFLVCCKCALPTFKNCDTEILGADTVSNVVLTYSTHIKNRHSLTIPRPRILSVVKNLSLPSGSKRQPKVC